MGNSGQSHSNTTGYNHRIRDQSFVVVCGNDIHVHWITCESPSDIILSHKQDTKDANFTTSINAA